MLKYSKKSDVIILLPVYEPNTRFLLEQIDSLKQQTFQDWYCYLLFDGLQVLPEEILKSLDSRFYTFRGPNQGVYHNLERGIGLALENTDFKYFFFCDQDDLWDSKKLEVQLDFLMQKQISLVHCDLREINENNKLTAKSVWKKEKRSNP